MCTWRKPFPAIEAKRLRAWGFCRRSGWAAVVFLLLGCGEHPQSMLHPASAEAAELARLWWVMCVVYTLVFVAVMGLLAAGLWGRRRATGPPGGALRFVVLGGIAIPGVILVGMLFYSLKASAVLRIPETALRIEVVGHQWWWEVRYPDHGIVTANELHIPAGEPVALELRAADVIHSFWVPNLHGKMDLLPEVTNRFWLRAQRPGIFRGQCAEFCGVQHALMAFMVVALPPDEFRQWLADRQRPVPEPETARLAHGRAVFFEAACHNCHAIRGSEALGLIGPDLTHIGSRLTLGAGTLTNSPGNLAGWIVNPQPLKPGNRMPPSYLEPADLHALVDYLISLE